MFLCGQSLRGCAKKKKKKKKKKNVFFLEFYSVKHMILLYFIFFLFKHELHFCDFSIFYNDFIIIIYYFIRISLRTM